MIVTCICIQFHKLLLKKTILILTVVESTPSLGIFMAFHQHYSMDYLQVRNSDSGLSHSVYGMNHEPPSFSYTSRRLILYCNVWFQAVLLKKLSGSEGDKVDVQKLFGYIGLFTLLGLWWLGMIIILLWMWCSWFAL